MNVTKEQAAQALGRISKAIIETIDEAGPLGAPAGVLYAALMSFGMSLEVFERLMGSLVSRGLIAKRGHCYYSVKK